MDLGIDFLSVLAFFLTTLFAFWPLLLLGGILISRVNFSKVLFMWLLLFLIRVLIVLMPFEGLQIIPEPLSTSLFLLSGAGILVIVIVQRRRGNSRIKSGSAFSTTDDFQELNPEEFEELGAARLPGRHPIHEGEELDVLIDREITVERESLGEVTEPVVERSPRPPGIGAEGLRLAGARSQQPGQHAQG